MHLELVSKLLNTERQYQLSANRASILKELKKCFETSARDKESAIQAAHRDRDLKQAVEAGDVEVVKTLTHCSAALTVNPPTPTWAALKFGSQEHP